MKKTFYSFLLAIFMLHFVSCVALTGMQSKTAPASLFTYVTEPVSNSGAVAGPKRGEACAVNALGIVSIGDASIASARNAGGIQKVATVDNRFLNVLFLFGQYCTIVTGE
jgi:hypothetical protein